MTRLFLSATALSLLVTAVTLAGPDSDAAAALALALSSKVQVPTSKTIGAVTCDCDGDSSACTCPVGKCQCGPGGVPCSAPKHKPIKVSDADVIVLSKSNCPPCKRLETELDNNGHAVGLNWMTYKDDDKQEAVYGGIQWYPTIVLVRGGVVVAKYEGYTSAQELANWRHKMLTGVSSNQGVQQLYMPQPYQTQPILAQPISYAQPIQQHFLQASGGFRGGFSGGCSPRG